MTEILKERLAPPTHTGQAGKTILRILILFGLLYLFILSITLMGSSFNLSPIIILLNLALWGSIWGIPGMFLCVPFLIIVAIILSHFPQTRPIAIFLSSDGNLRVPEDKIIQAFDLGSSSGLLGQSKQDDSGNYRPPEIACCQFGGSRS